MYALLLIDKFSFQGPDQRGVKKEGDRKRGGLICSAGLFKLFQGVCGPQLR